MNIIKVYIGEKVIYKKTGSENEVIVHSFLESWNFGKG